MGRARTTLFFRFTSWNSNWLFYLLSPPQSSKSELVPCPKDFRIWRLPPPIPLCFRRVGTLGWNCGAIQSGSIYGASIRWFNICLCLHSLQLWVSFFFVHSCSELHWPHRPTSSFLSSPRRCLGAFGVPFTRCNGVTEFVPEFRRTSGSYRSKMGNCRDCSTLSCYTSEELEGNALLDPWMPTFY